MKLILLGTGTPNAEPWASFPAYALVVHGKVYLVDCGPGVIRACTTAFYNGVSELRPQNLQQVFITHMHSDHCGGLGELILIPWVLDRERPLHVFGPNGIDSMCSHLLWAYDVDIGFRDDGPQPANDNGIRVMTHTVEEGVVYEEDGLIVRALPVRHGTLKAYAYRFESDGKTIVISGDTAPVKEMVDFCKDCDILVHEAEYSAGLSQRTEPWQDYHRQVHTMSTDLARLMNAAKPQLTITTHRILHLNFYDTEPVDMEEVRKREDALLAEIRERSDCNVINGHDQEVYTI